MHRPCASDLAYRPDIDGLRAVAVLSVIGFHAGVRWFPGGYAGVDIFFVISGFLITSIILRQLAEDRFSFADFYARRCKRIFPALIIVLAAVFAFGWMFLLPNEYERIGKHIVAGAGRLVSRSSSTFCGHLCCYGFGNENPTRSPSPSVSPAFHSRLT